MDHAAQSVRMRVWWQVQTAVLAACVFAGSALLSLWLLAHMPRAVHIQGAVMLLIVVVVGLLGIIGVLRRRHELSAEVALLQCKLRDIRAGVAPIEELSQLEGNLAALTPQLQEILRDLRQQRAEVARLADETRQRVAQRTDALEREIGALRQQAIKDPLTGLYNRRMLDQALPALVSRCREQRCDLSLLMMDLDCFKFLNDTLGHAAGDQVLRDLGQIIRSTIRQHDLGFRCGGDEFVVLLVGAPPSAAESLAGRLRALVDGLAKPLRLAKPVGLSVGAVSMSEKSDTTPGELLAEADRRLYASKGAGRR